MKKKVSKEFKKAIQEMSIVERRMLLIFTEAPIPLDEQQVYNRYYERWGNEGINKGDFADWVIMRE